MIIDLKTRNISLTEALNLASEYDEILLDSKTYYEKVRIGIPHLTLKGREGSKISFDDYHGKPTRVEDSHLGEEYGTTTSATVTVTSDARFFRAENVTFENTHYLSGNHYQAVAFKSEGNNTTLKNCKFIGRQDTLMFDFTKGNLVKNCYIEGDVDFIFGSSDVTLIGCEILAKDYSGGAYYTAPSTLLVYDYGFVFYDCTFKSETNVIPYLGRPWFPTKAPAPVHPRASFVNCSFDKINPTFIGMSKSSDDIELVIANSNSNGVALEEKGNSQRILDYLKRYINK